MHVCIRIQAFIISIYTCVCISKDKGVSDKLAEGDDKVERISINSPIEPSYTTTTNTLSKDKPADPVPQYHYARTGPVKVRNKFLF